MYGQAIDFPAEKGVPLQMDPNDSALLFSYVLRLGCDCLMRVALDPFTLTLTSPAKSTHCYSTK